MLVIGSSFGGLAPAAVVLLKPGFDVALFGWPGLAQRCALWNPCAAFDSTRVLNLSVHLSAGV